MNPYASRIFRPSALFKNAKKALAPSLSFALLRMTTACSIGGCVSSGISQRLPSRIGGDTASDNARIPAWALPDATNCAACAIFSPYTSLLLSCSYTPALRNAATAARSEEHTSELQSHLNLVCRLLL